MFQKHLVSLVLLVGASFVLWPADAGAQSWDAFPELAPGQHLRIKKRYDGPKYDDLRGCLRRFDSKVGAEYFAAIVDITAASGKRSKKENDAMPYAEAIAEEWKENGLDDEKGVLFVTGLRNDSLAIRVGPAWKKIGFEGEVVTDTITTSEYEKFARRRDYTDALCSLATAVDFRLAGLRQRMNRRIEDVRSTFPTIKERYEQLVTRVAETVPEGVAFGDPLREKLNSTKENLDEAETKVEDDPTASVNLVDAAETSMDEVEAALDRYTSVTAELELVKKELEELAASIDERPDASWEGPIEGTQMLDGCREQVQKIEANLDGTPEEVRVCLADVKTRLARADVHHHYLAGVFPTIIAISAVIFIALVVAFLFLRRRRTLRLVRRDLEVWSDRLKGADSELNAIRENFVDYFASGDRVWSGESAELGASTSDAINLAHYLHAEGRKLEEQARSLSDGHPLEVFNLEEAARIIRESSLSVAAGSTVASSPLSVPLQNGYQQDAAHLPGDLTRAVADARFHLSESAKVMSRVSAEVRGIDETSERTARALERRAEFGADNSHLVERFNQAVEVWKQTRKEALSDPIRADRGESLRAISEPLEAIRDRAISGNLALEEVRGPLKSRHSELKRVTDSLARSGVSVVEKGFDANAELAIAESISGEIEALVATGKESEATERLEALTQKLDELEVSLGMITAGQALVGEMTRTIESMRDDLKGDILKLRIALGKDDVEVEQDVLDELSRIQGSLVRLSGDLGRIRKLHSDGETLASMRGLAALVELFESGAALVTELSRQFEVDTRMQSAEIPWPEGWAKVNPS